MGVSDKKKLWAVTLKVKPNKDDYFFAHNWQKWKSTCPAILRVEATGQKVSIILQKLSFFCENVKFGGISEKKSVLLITASLQFKYKNGKFAYICDT